MTQKQKAKAYDEAIERAKAMIKVANNREETYNSVITIFPELKESEDERGLSVFMSLPSEFEEDDKCKVILIKED